MQSEFVRLHLFAGRFSVFAGTKASLKGELARRSWVVEPAAAKRQRISPLPFLLFIDYTRFLLTPDPSYARRSGHRRHGALYAQGIIENSIGNQQFSLFTPLQSCIFSYVVCHNSFGQTQYNRCKGSSQFILLLTLVGENFLFIIEKQKNPPSHHFVHNNPHRV